MIFYGLGLYFLVLGIIAVFGNYCVLRVFGSTPALKTPSNLLVLNLAASDMLMVLTMFPEMIYNFFTGGPWRAGELVCNIHAFCGALMGGTQILTLTMISWDRYNVIVKGLAGTPLTFRKSVLLIMIAWLISLAWAVAPLFGVGAFTLDSMLGSCSYDGLTTTTMNKYYMLAYASCMYFLPVAVIGSCYFFIVQAVFKHEDEMRQQAKKMNVTSLRSSADQNQMSAEVRVAKIAIINVTLWLVAWTPYMVFCLMGTWGDQSGITPLLSEMQSLLAKTSCAYNPIIYCLSHPKFREVLKKLHPWICIVIQEKTSAGDSQSTSSSKTEASEMAASN
jgi:r-opsin